MLSFITLQVCMEKNLKVLCLKTAIRRTLNYVCHVVRTTRQAKTADHDEKQSAEPEDAQLRQSSHCSGALTCGSHT